MDSTGYLSYIHDMLKLHSAVVIPGLGGFITKYKPAKVETDRIIPPTKYIAFNERLDLPDNAFATYLDENTEAHYSPRLYDKFISDLKNDLEANQVIVIPKVGRLYQDYEGTRHFMPDLFNLNNDSYGLPVISSQKGQWYDDTITVVPKKQLLDRSLGQALNAVAVVLFCFALVWLTVPNRKSSTATELSVIDLVIDSPSISGTGPSTTESMDEIGSAKERIEYVAPKISNAPVIALDQSAIIIVGAFGNPDNTEKMTSKIEQKGFEAYTDKIGSLSRVGLKVSYSTQEELETILSTIQKDITSRAWILK